MGGRDDEDDPGEALVKEMLSWAGWICPFTRPRRMSLSPGNAESPPPAPYEDVAVPSSGRCAATR